MNGENPKLIVYIHILVY